MDFVVSFWPQFGRKWHKIRWKSHHFLGKCHGNSMTWPCPKIHVMFQHGKQIKPGCMTWNRHGISCQFQPNCLQVELWREMTGNFHENPCHIFYRDDSVFNSGFSQLFYSIFQLCEEHFSEIWEVRTPFQRVDILRSHVFCGGPRTKNFWYDFSFVKHNLN